MTNVVEPKDGMFRRFIFALGANLGSRAIGIAVQVLGAAAFVRCWGVHLYGEWLVLTAVPAYLAMSDLGFAAAAANQMSMASAQGRAAEAERTFRECLGLICVASFVVVLLVCVLVQVWDPARVLQLTMISRRTAAAVLEILSLQVAVSLFGELLLGGFRCANRFAEGLMLNNIGQVGELVGTLAALYFRVSPVSLAAILLALRVVRMGLVAAGAYRRMRDAGLSGRFGPLFSFSAMRELVGPAAGFAAFPLSRALTGQGLLIIIGRFIGPQAVVVLSAGRTMSRLVSVAAELLAGSIYAEITTAFATSRFALLRRLQIIVTQLALLIGGGATLLLALLRQPLTHLWLGSAVIFPASVIALLCTSETVSAAYRVSLVMLSGTNNHMRTSLIYCGLSASAVALSAVFSGIFHASLPWVIAPVVASEIMMFFWTTTAASAAIGSRRGESMRKFFSLTDLCEQAGRFRFSR